MMMPPFRDLILGDRAAADTPVLALEFARRRALDLPGN
jgi:hypothetical protein